MMKVGDLVKHTYDATVWMVAKIDWSGALLLAWGDTQRWAMAHSVEVVNAAR